MQRILASTVAGLLALGFVAGCGSSGGVVSPSTPSNNTSNSTNAIGNSSPTNSTPPNSTPPNSTATMTLVTIRLANGQSVPAISFKVPSGWTKTREGQGDTHGYAWINPNDKNQQIQMMVSANASAIKNYTTGQWNVTGIFGIGTKGITWNNISTNKLTASFTNTTGLNPFSTNEQTPYTGYGKAFISTQNPQPFSVYVEVWGKQSLADAVLPTIQLQE